MNKPNDTRGQLIATRPEIQVERAQELWYAQVSVACREDEFWTLPTHELALWLDLAEEELTK